MQANQTPVIWTVVICSLALLIAGAFVYTAIPTAEDVASQVDVPTDAEIQLAVNTAINSAVDKIDIPTIDNSKLDRVCELTDGCEFYELSEEEDLSQIYEILNNLDEEEAWDDYEEALIELLKFDEDYFDLGYSDMRDYQIRAYSDNDKDKGNWEIKVFVRQEYKDTDKYYALGATDAIYLLITSTLDKNDYDSLSIKAVNRNFEFD